MYNMAGVVFSFQWRPQLNKWTKTSIMQLTVFLESYCTSHGLVSCPPPIVLVAKEEIHEKNTLIDNLIFNMGLSSMNHECAL